ncbi:hypothetical protein JXB12_08295 [candidate division KSB1 bacterium]|nr:hypothetical protein [candidate division KSB1 bacterium]
MYKLSFLICLCIIAVAATDCRSVSNLSDSLLSDIEDGRLDDFTNIEAAFIISGTEDETSLKQAIDWHQSILQKIHELNIFDVFAKEESAEKIFHFLHATWLRKYVRTATTLIDIKQNQEFNCVSATILYNLTCDELGLNTMAFETPTHVYTIFSDFGHDIMVENTTSLGFNIIKNLHNYSNYMAQYYPQNQLYKIGLDRLYTYENSKGRRISNTELLGLICYNQAYFSADRNEFEEAYNYVLMAQLFNQDSRSNVNFEISLYYRHGKRLYDLNDFHSAFQLFADAYYRYPSNSDFRLNCINSYFKSLHMDWLQKDWTRIASYTYEIADLDVLEDQHLVDIHTIFYDWAVYFAKRNDRQSGIEALNLIKIFSKLNNRERQIETMLHSIRDKYDLH